MLHNLFHSLPCIHSRDPNFLTLQIWPAPQYMWNHHSLNILCLLDMSLNKYTFLPHFYDTWFFWHHRFNAYTHSLSQKFILLESHLIPFSLSCQCQSIRYRLSISSFCTPYILTYQPIIDIYGFAFFPPFFWYTKISYPHCIFWPVTFADIVSFFQRLNNVSPSFFSPMKRFFSTFLLFFFSQLCIFFFLTEQHTPCFLLLFMLIDINPPSFPQIVRLDEHVSSLPPQHFRAPWQLRSSGVFPFFSLPRSRLVLVFSFFFLFPLLAFISIHIVYSASLSSLPILFFFHLDNCFYSFL